MMMIKRKYGLSLLILQFISNSNDLIFFKLYVLAKQLQLLNSQNCLVDGTNTQGAI